MRWARNSLNNSSNHFHYFCYFFRFKECSRRRAAAENKGRTASTLHCLPNGNFEELQCDNGICWCADERTGHVTNGSRAVPEHLWTALPCCKSKTFVFLKWAHGESTWIQSVLSHGHDIRIFSIRLFRFHVRWLGRQKRGFVLLLMIKVLGAQRRMRNI